MSGFPQQQQPWGQPQQQAPQGFAPQPQPQQFQGGQGSFAPGQFQQPQPGYQQPAFQPNQPQMPQLQRVTMGQGYTPGQFPHCNDFHGIGQVFPNQWIPQGFEYKANQGKPGGTLNINVKIREAWGTEPNQVKVQFIRVVAFGDAAMQLVNQLRAGMIVEFTGNFRPNRYKSQKTQKINTVNQVVLNTRAGAMPFKVIGELPMYEEINPRDAAGGWGQPQQNFGGPQQPQQQPQAWGAPQGQPPFQQAPQGLPMQQPMQAPQQQPQQWLSQPQGQPSFQQPMQAPMQPQQAPPQFQQPQQQPPQGWAQPQQSHQAAGMPAQPAPGQVQGNFAPPQQAQTGFPMPQAASQGAPQGGFTPPPGMPPM
jgi:hypothetical protein